MFLAFKRLAFCQYIQGMLATNTDVFANDMRDKVWPKMSTAQLFVQSFDQGKARAADGAEDDDGVCSGLTASTNDAFETFLQQLQPLSQGIATILADVHRGSYDDDVLEIASAEVRSGTFSFAWQDLFGQGGAELGPNTKKAKVVQAPRCGFSHSVGAKVASCVLGLD